MSSGDAAPDGREQPEDRVVREQRVAHPGGREDPVAAARRAARAGPARGRARRSRAAPRRAGGRACPAAGAGPGSARAGRAGRGSRRAATSARRPPRSRARPASARAASGSPARARTALRPPQFHCGRPPPAQDPSTRIRTAPQMRPAASCSSRCSSLSRRPFAFCWMRRSMCSASSMRRRMKASASPMPLGRRARLLEQLAARDHVDHHLGQQLGAQQRVGEVGEERLGGLLDPQHHLFHALRERRSRAGSECSAASSVRSSLNTTASAPLPISLSANEAWISLVPS